MPLPLPIRILTQCEQPTRGDWVSTVKQDLAEVKINMSFEEIANVSEEAFKNFVKEKVQKAALDYLKNLQLIHSKSKNQCYNELSLQGYLKSGTSNMTIKEKSFCFAARSRMIDVRCNYPQGQGQLMCRLGCNKKETQNHLLECGALTDSNIVQELPTYADIHGKDIAKMERTSKILQAKFKLLKELYELNQVNRSSKSCSASNIGVYVPHVNTDTDDLD